MIEVHQFAQQVRQTEARQVRIEIHLPNSNQALRVVDKVWERHRLVLNNLPFFMTNVP